MKSIIIVLLLVGNLLAYKKDDVISKDMANHLGCVEKDKIYIVDFFASWCGSCKKEIPLMSKLNNNIDKTKVEIIGIDVDKKVQNGIKFQNYLKAQNQLNFKVINDPQNFVISEFSPIGMPTLYYIQNRKILGIVTGAVDDIDLKILNDLKRME